MQNVVKWDDNLYQLRAVTQKKIDLRPNKSAHCNTFLSNVLYHLFLAERQKYCNLEARYKNLLSSIEEAEKEITSLQEMRNIAWKVDHMPFKHLYSLLPKQG